MFKNRKFSFYAATLCVTGLLYTLICAGLENGQTQLIRSVITAAGGGWTDRQIQLPMTVGSFLAVPLAFVCCIGFFRAGVREMLILCALASAAGCVGVVCANGLDIYGGALAGNYPLFCLSLAVMRASGVMVQLALALLCLTWFVRFRGRALGVVTMGTPIFAAVGAAALANFVKTVLSGDHRPFYLGVAAALAVLALVTRFLLRDRPEEAGLYPDGEGRPPAGEPLEEEAAMPLSQVLRSRQTWLSLLAAGTLVMAAAGCLDFLEPRLLARHGGGPTLLNRAAPWLALGTIFGIPFSYIFGWLCDKLGTRWTAALLGLAELGTAYALWAFPKDTVSGDTAVWIPLCLGVACLMGGVSTVVPCIVGHVFGRRQILSAGRVIFPALLLLGVLVRPLGSLLGGGGQSRLFLVLAVLAGTGVLASLFLRSPAKQDGKKQKEK